MGTEQVDTLIHRARSLFSTDTEMAIKLLDEALIMARRLDYRRGIALAIRERASGHLAQQHFKRALTGFTEALEFFKQLDDKSAMIACHNRISGIYFKLGECAPALEHVLANLQLHTANSDSHGIAECYNDIGNIYSYLQSFDKAIEHYKKALRIFEGLRNRREIINSFYMLATGFRAAGDDDRCMYYLLRATNALEDVLDNDLKAKILVALGDLYTRQRDFEKALSTFKSAMNLAGTSVPVKVQSKKSLGRLYIELTQYDKAIEVLREAMENARLLPPESGVVHVFRLLATAYELMGDHENALKYFKQYHDLDRQVLSETVNLKTRALHLRHDLDELKKQKEFAELSDKLKEQFLANVSHEIRTPMNGVLGMTHLLKKTRLDKEQKEYIDAIRDSANNLMVIINDILDFSKINAGKVEFEKTEFRLRDLVKGVMQILKVRADEKQLQLNVNIDYRIGEKIKGDPIRLNQILMNLLGNAIKFTDRGSVRMDIKQTASEAGICRIRFSISDTGQGIPEMKLEKIFESFEQVEENNKRRTEGTGLGLTIVKQLVELQGGNIHVKSKVGEGSEFVFELDFGCVSMETRPETQSPDSGKQDPIVSSIRILIVEDNKVNQLLVKNMLRQMGCIHLETADGGKSAIRKLETEEFDLVLMDIQMPDMDGYEATHHIRTRLPDPMKKIPVIALTADASEKEKSKAKEAGMDDYVVKPYTPEELFAAIRKQTDKIRKDPDLKRIQEKRQAAMIRLEVLDKFTGGDPELTAELMEVFLRQIPDAIQRIGSGIQKNDWKEVFAVSHKIKSSLSVFGLNDLRRIAQLMEEHARELERLDEIPGLFNSFKEKIQLAVPEVEAELQRLRGSIGTQSN